MAACPSPRMDGGSCAKTGIDAEDTIRSPFCKATDAAQHGIDGLAGIRSQSFEALRAKRMEIARAQNVPPYVIFHDKTLIELATIKPASAKEMAEIPGVGDTKLERYGPAFLAAIMQHAAGE